jgi:hypothetical protein
MALRHTIYAYKTSDINQFKTAVINAAKKVGAVAELCKPKSYQNELKIVKGFNSISIMYPYGTIYDFLQRLSAELDAIPWISVRIQEGSHWDYSLHRGFVILDDFSTYPQYWTSDDDPIENLRRSGWPEMLELAWDTPKEKFCEYLRHWYWDYDEDEENFRNSLAGKAYPNDEFEYGRYEQFWDFLRSLGIVDPWTSSQENVETISLHFPDRKMI